MASPTDRSSTAERRELLAKATPGPWRQPWGADDPCIESEEQSSPNGPWSMCIYDEGGHDEHDAALIVAAVNDYARHLDMEEALADALRAIDAWRDGSGQFPDFKAWAENARALLTGATDHGK